MTVTIAEFAKYLLAQSVHYYWANKTVHCRVLPDGRVRYWANWEGDISREFATLEALMAYSSVYLPNAEDLAAAEPVWKWEPKGKKVAVSLTRLRSILEYLHDSEADHYADTVETYPEDVNHHVYTHVLAIEAELTATETDSAPAPQSRSAALSNDVLCELAHNLTVRECRIRDVTVDASETDDHDGETRYTDEAEGIFDALHGIAWSVLEPYCEKGGAR